MRTNFDSSEDEEDGLLSREDRLSKETRLRHDVRKCTPNAELLVPLRAPDVDTDNTAGDAADSEPHTPPRKSRNQQLKG
jgi:hypothetical protein